jgi:hypothetical protein
MEDGEAIGVALLLRGKDLGLVEQLTSGSREVSRLTRISYMSTRA